MSEINLTQEFDASVWVDEWMKAIKNDRSIATSEGTMLGWFANAIMAGYDKARAERDEWKQDAERLKGCLDQWYMAWITDCITPQANGNEAFGLDEGLVLCARMMKPILEETRLLLGKAEVVE